MPAFRHFGYQFLHHDVKHRPGGESQQVRHGRRNGRSQQHNQQSADGLFVMGAYAQISEEQHPLTVKVAEDAYGNVGSIVAIPDNSDDDKTLYSYCLNNYETLGLGEWLGAKYNVYAEDGTSEGGVFQTVAETLDLVDENDVNTLSVYAIFGIVPGRAYAVPGFEDGRFKFQIMNNFLRLDYSVIYDIIGSDYNAFAEANHIIGFKMSMLGQNYFYIDYALDLMDNAFSCDFNTDSEMSSVTSIVLYGPENTDEQLEIWKDYASSAETLQIGEFKEAYTSSFGMQVDTFESAADALEYVNTNGRPAGGFDPDVVMVFGNESVSLTITLKSGIAEFAEKHPVEFLRQHTEFSADVGIAHRGIFIYPVTGHHDPELSVDFLHPVHSDPTFSFIKIGLLSAKKQLETDIKSTCACRNICFLCFLYDFYEHCP